jgi:hypothetical protein
MVAAADQTDPASDYDARKKALRETCPLLDMACATLARESINLAESIVVVATSTNSRGSLVSAAMQLGICEASIAAASDSCGVAQRVMELIRFPEAKRLLAELVEQNPLPKDAASISRCVRVLRVAAGLIVEWYDRTDIDDEDADDGDQVAAAGDPLIADPMIRGEIIACLKIVRWCIANPRTYHGRPKAPEALYKSLDMVRATIRDSVDDCSDMVRVDERAAAIVVELGIAGLRDRIDAIEHGRRTGEWTCELEDEANRMVSAAIERLGG